jgi:penicillin-binding protein 1B
MLDQKPETKPVLDPRVNAVLVDMLEEVMRSGTAAGVRSRGFSAIAAGKTGTDPTNGWFAGFTSDLLCIVWVGFDDNRELQIEGAKSALPVWTEFMKRAITLRQYSNPRPFQKPSGVVTVAIDPLSGMLATPSCPKTSEAVYISGTEPVGYCPLHGGKGAGTTVSGWDVSSTETVAPSQGYITGLQPRRNSSAGSDGPPRRDAVPAAAVTVPKNATSTQEPKKKGFFDRFKGIFH